MDRIFALEIRKSLKTKGFLVSLCVGIAIALLQSIWFYRNIYVMNNDELAYVLESDVTGKMYGQWFEIGVMQGWIGCEVYSQYNQLFFLIFPLMATFPYAGSLYREFKSGYTGQIITRCGRKRYYTAKLVAVFLSGGLAVTLPLLVSYILTLCYLPLIPTDPLSLQAIVANKDMWAELYYEHPLAYAAVYMAVDFVYAGIFACLALASTFLFNNIFSILSFPFILCYCLQYGADNILYDFRGYNPADIINPSQSMGGNTTLAVSITTAIAVVLTVIWYYILVRKRDIRKER